MAILLDGTTQYGSRADASALSAPAGDWAIGGWVRVDDLSGASFQYLWSHGALNASNSVNVYLREASSGGGRENKATVAVEDALANNVGFDSTGTPGTSSAWQHWVLQRKSTNLELYFAGSSEGSAAIGSLGAIDPVTALNIGRRVQDATRFFTGGVAEFFKISRSLTAGEIASLAAGVNLTTIEPSPDVYWRILDNTSPSADLGPNNLPLTLNGSPASLTHPFSDQSVVPLAMATYARRRAG